MAIRKGQPWGEPADPPDSAVSVSSDIEGARLFAAAQSSGESPEPLLLLGGDLFRTLGGREGRDPVGTRFLVDVGEVRHEEGCDYFVAHLVARRSWWHGRVLAVMNAEFHRRWMLGPRAHPGDGLLDVSDADPTFRQRLLALPRLTHGDHIPHPDIVTTRGSTFEFTLGRPTPLWADGCRVGESAGFSVSVLPEQLEVYV